MKLFSWLCQNVNKKIDAYNGCDANDSGTDLPTGDAMSRQDISTLSRVLIEFEAPKYMYSIFNLYSKCRGYSIQYSIRMKFEIGPILISHCFFFVDLFMLVTSMNRWTREQRVRYIFIHFDCLFQSGFLQKLSQAFL